MAVNLPREGKVALVAFLAYFFLTLTLVNQESLRSLWSFLYSAVFVTLGWSVTIITPHSHSDVSTRAGFLGTAFGISAVASFSSSSFQYFGWYMASLSFFHFSEYIMIAVYNPKQLSIDSFLLNHSPEYKIAAVASWFEFMVEAWLFPSLKNHFFVSFIGFVLILGGEAARKLAMITAKSNFSHIVQSRKVEGHVLVTHGIYAWCRHPAYFGWFFWSIGTQLTLCNPVCLIGYTLASWHFFNERIRDEEMLLLHFFQEQYLDYQNTVGTGLPFVKGFQLDPETMKEK